MAPMAAVAPVNTAHEPFELAWATGLCASIMRECGPDALAVSRVKAGCRAIWQAAMAAERQAATARVKAVLTRATLVDESVPGWEDRSALGWLEQSVLAAANVKDDRRKAGKEG